MIKNVQLVDIMGGDLRSVNAARVSYNKHHQEFEETRDSRLIEYLVKNGHKSPFYHTQLTFKIKMPIFVARQWFRHHVGFSRSEISRRYVDSEISFYGFKHLRRSDPDKKQGSSEEPIENENDALKIIGDHNRQCVIAYRKLLDMGVCREQARVVLPLNLETEFIETGSLWAYLNLIKERTEPGAQKEIREFALEVLAILQRECPVTVEAFHKYVMDK